MFPPLRAVKKAALESPADSKSPSPFAFLAVKYPAWWENRGISQYCEERAPAGIPRAFYISQSRRRSTPWCIHTKKFHHRVGLFPCSSTNRAAHIICVNGELKLKLDSIVSHSTCRSELRVRLPTEGRSLASKVRPSTCPSPCSSAFHREGFSTYNVNFYCGGVM